MSEIEAGGPAPAVILGIIIKSGHVRPLFFMLTGLCLQANPIPAN